MRNTRVIQRQSVATLLAVSTVHVSLGSVVMEKHVKVLLYTREFAEPDNFFIQILMSVRWKVTCVMKRPHVAILKDHMCVHVLWGILEMDLTVQVCLGILY